MTANATNRPCPARGAQSGRLHLPVNLLVQGWPCLVVGGGAVAHRKTGLLLQAGARVRVVSPALCPELAALEQTGQVEHAARCFEAADVAGCRLVFAATNRRAVNRQVLDAARAAGCLCCCVDGNWPDGDLVTPAALHKHGLTVAVSTGGSSCRRARLVKQSLSRHIATLETAEPLVLGTSHEQLDLERREPFHLTGRAMERAGNMLMQIWGVHEFMLLNTCNRVELIAITSAESGTNGVLEHILGYDRLAVGEYYRLRGYEAFEHLALVTAGMHSQSLGEYHVTAQVKAALDHGLQQGWSNGMLQEWVSAALHISKHIKHEVTPLLPSAEIEDLALEYLDARGVPARGAAATAMIVGTGVVGRSLVKGVLQRGFQCVWCYHLNRPEPEVGWEASVRIVQIDGLKDHLADCSVVFCATDAPHHVLHTGHAPFFDRSHAVLIVDLGVPRNVSPDLAQLLPHAEIANLDQIKRWSYQQQGHLAQAMEMSRRAAETHRESYDALIESFQGRNQAE
jgi:glutamyl-tRNA reductase